MSARVNKAILPLVDLANQCGNLPPNGARRKREDATSQGVTPDGKLTPSALCSARQKAKANTPSAWAHSGWDVERLGDTGTRFYVGHIDDYAKGRRVPPLQVVLAYARAGGMTMEVIVDDELDLPNKPLD